MRTSRLTTTAFWSLLVVSVFNALSAIAGGIAILATDGLGMPSSMLAGGPFTTFTWPGLILLVVVGGSQTLAAVLLIARRPSALLWSAVAGFGMMIWIFVETGIIRGLSWLQVVYFATGALQVILVLALLGVAGWLPRVSPGIRSTP
ncbi:hypothetical protein ACPPVQ_04750 [Diaminobutyricibacter sp. McL0618]|uniref:hypothetical protein n=1 Tax=Leifsonia sp. McL0618 TaxID=3415677 RepID=UPI003CEA55F3